MQPLDFDEIMFLLNRSRTTHINKEPIKKEEGMWALYEGEYKVHFGSMSFDVLYINSKASLDGIERAKSQAFTPNKTQVVYPPTLGEKTKNNIPFRQTIRNLFKETAKGPWTTKEYLRTFIKDELQAYVLQLPKKSPPYYIDPHVTTPGGSERRIPNPLGSFLLDPEPDDYTANGVLGILLAEPGQGKTYMCHHLVSEVINSRADIVPLMIESSQWETLPPKSQYSLWKILTHCFAYYKSPIGWIEGCEDTFLKTTLKSGLFRIIFDGFDEYILHNWGHIQPMDVLESLADLALETGAKIIITSRTSFWKTNLPEGEIAEFLKKREALLYEILPFDLNNSRNYFMKRIPDSSQVENAIEVYKSLGGQNNELVGRGFVLNLIADLVDHSIGEKEFLKVQQYQSNALLWLMEKLCQREELRQDLKFTALQQVNFLRSFAWLLATGDEAITSNLELAISDERPDLTKKDIQDTLEKLKSHPLIGRTPGKPAKWLFKHKQIQDALISEEICKTKIDDISSRLRSLRLREEKRVDLAPMIVDMLLSQFSSNSDKLCTWLENALRTTINGEQNKYDGKYYDLDGIKLLTDIILSAVDKERPYGKPEAREDRTKLLLRITTGPTIKGLIFTRAIMNYDFRDINFELCHFDHVRWARCYFNKNTVFKKCRIIGGFTFPNCEGFGSIRFDDGCIIDHDAQKTIRAISVKEGLQPYSKDDLASDISLLINKFVIRNGADFIPVKLNNLRKGPITTSRYCEKVIDTLLKFVLEERKSPDQPERELQIRDDAFVSTRFYINNNVFTGPLKKAYNHLVSKLIEKEI